MLANELEQVDDLIYTHRRPSDSPDECRNLGIEENLLKTNTGGLHVTAGILRREPRRYCSRCDLLIDEHDDPRECDNCEAGSPRSILSCLKSLSRLIRSSGPNSIKTRMPTMSHPVCIQFVGGDRGGGQKNQLQVPKEYGSIKSAIKAADYSDRLELADPVYAAKVEIWARSTRPIRDSFVLPATGMTAYFHSFKTRNCLPEPSR